MNKFFYTVLVAVIAGSQSGCLHYKAWRMSKEEITVLNTTKIRDYRLVLIKKQAWVGPPNFFYQLREKSLFGQYKTKYSTEITMPDTLKCIFELKNKRNQSLRVDKCEGTIIKTN